MAGGCIKTRKREGGGGEREKTRYISPSVSFAWRNCEISLDAFNDKRDAPLP